MSFLKDVSPSGAAYDLIAYIRAERDHNWLFWLAACAPPALIVHMFIVDGEKKSVPPPPTVTYFESWPATRTRAESLEAIEKRQIQKDAFLEKKREGYKALGRAMGMDVDEIEREGMRIRKEARAAAAKAKAEAEEKKAERSTAVDTAATDESTGKDAVITPPGKPATIVGGAAK